MKIGFVLTDNMLATSSSWPSEMWFAAQQLARASGNDAQRIKITTVARHIEPIRCHAGLRLSPDHTFDDGIIYDLVYLPALWRNPRPIVKQEQTLVSWLQKQYENGATLCAVGTGCCFIAETGLLNYKPATTHWYYFDQFQQDYPQIELKRQHFITEAGRLYCAASINSLADLTVHFIQRLYGKAIAQHIERHFLHEIRQAYDTSSYVEKQNANHPDETILQAQLWLQDHLSEDINIQQLATDFGMSERNFSRRFKQASGQSPSHFLQEIRVNNAQDLLQYSNLNIGEIADRVGFSDISYFAKIFKKNSSVSPREYRTMVRSKLFNSDS